jgi:hypothetical protein
MIRFVEPVCLSWTKDLKNVWTWKPPRMMPRPKTSPAPEEPNVYRLRYESHDSRSSGAQCSEYEMRGTGNVSLLRSEDVF